MEALARRVVSRDVNVAVIGLGYAGLASAGAFLKAGYSVVGVDIDPSRVASLIAGEEPFGSSDGDLHRVLRGSVSARRFVVTAEADVVRDCHIVVVAVPTPVTRAKKPDYTMLREACTELGARLAQDTLVVIESTLSPGTSESVVIPALERASKKVEGRDFLVAHVPQRVCEGKLLLNATTLARACGGSSPAAAELAMLLYRQVTTGHVDPTDLVSAELTKTAENAYRDVQIAFANQLSVLCEQNGASFARVRALVNKCPERALPAAGAGVGGPCLTKDSWLLLNGEASESLPGDVIAAARALNDAMPTYAVARLVDLMGSAKGRTVVVCGLAHRAGSNELRETPGRAIAAGLAARGFSVIEHDPVLPSAASLEATLSGAHGVVFAVDHREYRTIDWEAVAHAGAPKPVVVDACGAIDARRARSVGLDVVALGDGTRARRRPFVPTIVECNTDAPVANT